MGQNSIQKLFLIVVVSLYLVDFTKCNRNLTLSSPRLTDFGEWGDWDRCPSNTFVIGMRLKTEPYQGPLDDTGLNGIQLLCGRIGESSRIIQSRKIHSAVGYWGSWGSSYECPGRYAVGFQLRSEPHHENHDDTAANNLRIYCSKSQGYLEGGGLQWGIWTDLQLCPWGHVICGLRTQVQSSQGSGSDDTSLNNVDMECCKLT